MSKDTISSLQQFVFDRSISLPDLLLKTVVIATELHQPHLLNWAKDEIEGYSPDAKLPSYRLVPSRLVVSNPFRGWIPVAFGDPEFSKIFETFHLRYPISELDHLVALAKANKESELHITLSSDLVSSLAKMTATQENFVSAISVSSVVALLDKVRTIVLQWTLNLQDQPSTAFPTPLDDLVPFDSTDPYS